jgi:hypothetical protein
MKKKIKSEKITGDMVILTGKAGILARPLLPSGGGGARYFRVGVV